MSSYYFLIVRIIARFLLFSLHDDVIDFFLKFSKKWIGGGNGKLKQKFLDNQKGKKKKKQRNVMTAKMHEELI